MFSTKRSLAVIAAAAAVFLLIAGCDQPTDGGGDSDRATVDVNTTNPGLSSSEEASTANFGSYQNVAVPNTKEDALTAVMNAFSTLGALTDSEADFNPSGDFSVNQFAPEQGDTDGSLSAGFSDAALPLATGVNGTVSLDADAEAKIAATTTEIQGQTVAETVALGGNGKIIADISELREDSADGYALTPRALDKGRLALSAGAGASLSASYDDSEALSQLSVDDYEGSITVSFAVTVSNQDANADPKPFGGNLLATFSFDSSGNFTIPGDQLASDDPSQLSQTLIDNIDTAQEVTVEVYESNGSTLKEDYTYTPEEIANILDGQQTSQSMSTLDNLGVSKLFGAGL